MKSSRERTGLHVRFTIAELPVGRVLVATTERGVCAVELGATDARLRQALALDFPDAAIERGDDAHRRWARDVLDLVRDPRLASGAVPLDLHGTAFQRRVWIALRSIPPGERRSYKEVAESIGQPLAARAVARACAANRVAVVIPCHRVVRGDGRLSGYKWGAERKKQLLDREAGSARGVRASRRTTR